MLKIVILSIAASVLVSACSTSGHETDPGGGGAGGEGGAGDAASLAVIGTACTTSAQCTPLNGGCFGGLCKGGDGDACVRGVGLVVDQGPCAPSYLCAPCSAAIFGSCKGAAVCLTNVDACYNHCGLAICAGLGGCP